MTFTLIPNIVFVSVDYTQISVQLKQKLEQPKLSCQKKFCISFFTFFNAIGPSGLYDHVNYENHYVKFSDENMKEKFFQEMLMSKLSPNKFQLELHNIVQIFEKKNIVTWHIAQQFFFFAHVAFLHLHIGHLQWNLLYVRAVCTCTQLTVCQLLFFSSLTCFVLFNCSLTLNWSLSQLGMTLPQGIPRLLKKLHLIVINRMITFI